ncbi:transposase, partial [Shigella dysenteriae]
SWQHYRNNFIFSVLFFIRINNVF